VINKYITTVDDKNGPQAGLALKSSWPA